MELKVEFNTRFEKKDMNFNMPNNSLVMLTPPINADYWVFRVQLHNEQALLAFPKFSTMGIGFAEEEDWNTNLPYTCDTEQIADHIFHNRIYDEISKDILMSAIDLIKTACKEYKNN